MPDYDFKSLSPPDFERLAGDLLNADLGLNLQSYPAGRDQGIDLRDTTPAGMTVVQCKHYARSTYRKLLSAAKEEAGKPGRLAASRYLLVTSRPLTALQQTELATTLSIPAGDVWGQDALNQSLGRNPDVERACFKLWLPSTAVLESIINAGRWNRSRALLDDIVPRAKYWVDTEPYIAVRALLARNGVCVVGGNPGFGKTFLADIVALRSSGEGWEIIDLEGRGIEEAWEAFRDGKKQLFIYDDFLGQAELSIAAAGEAGSLVDFVKHVQRHKDRANFLMTNRDFVLGRASNSTSDRLREISTQLPRVDVSLSSYGLNTRAEILFNHLYFADIGPAQRDRFALDNRMMAIVQHESFNPRTIAIVASRSVPSSTADGVLDQMLAALDDPVELWEVSFDALSQLAKSLLLTLATLPPTPIPHDDLRALAGAGSTTFEWQEALKTLEATWIVVARDAPDRPISFANPECRDYAINQLNDVDFAREAVAKIQRLDQLVAMSQSADLLNFEGFITTTTRRPVLATALLDQRKKLSEFIRRLAEESRAGEAAELYIVTLGEIAELLAVYGSADDADWLVSLIGSIVADERLLKTVSPSALFVLGARLYSLNQASQPERDAVGEGLVDAALRVARTTRDLDGYEALPASVGSPALHALAGERAREIISFELAVLRDSAPDLVSAADTAVDLEQRAHRYGFDVDVAGLLERAADAVGAETSTKSSYDANSSSWRDVGDSPQEIFSRFKEF
jgi:hypothetical protein